MILRSSSASVCCRVALCACVMPALLTQMSTRPSLSCANLARDSTSSARTGKLCHHSTPECNSQLLIREAEVAVAGAFAAVLAV